MSEPTDLDKAVFIAMDWHHPRKVGDPEVTVSIGEVAKQELEDLRAELERLHEALDEYGDHKGWCATTYPPTGSKCDCGFFEARAALKGEG